MVDLVIISKINLRQQCSAVRKKEVGQLCSIYAATMLKMMKESYIPDFEGWKKETMERKTAAWKRVFDAKWESFLKERNEREERARKELSIPFKQRMRMRQQTTEEEKKRIGNSRNRTTPICWRLERNGTKKEPVQHSGVHGRKELQNQIIPQRWRRRFITEFYWTTTPAKPPKCLNT